MSEAVRLADVLALLDELYDPRWAEEWDSVGLVVGDPDEPVRRVLFAVDPVMAVIQEAAAGDAQSGAAWALDGGAALYLLCLTVAQHVTDRGADARAARALAGVALVTLAALAGALTPVSFVACSAAALVALVVYEIRLGLALQSG